VAGVDTVNPGDGGSGLAGASENIVAPPFRVFLCHAVPDKPEVRNLYRRLRADGFEPWFDEQDLLPGQNWREEIPAAIHASAAVIVCLSPASITKEGYVQKEIKYALDVADEKPEGTIFVIPLKLKECDLPQRLNQLHCASLAETGGYERLVLALKKCAARQDARSLAVSAQTASAGSGQAGLEEHFFCADRFAERGEYTQASAEYEKILELDSGNVDARRRLIRVAREQFTLKAFPPGDQAVNIGLRRDHSRFAYVPDSEINRIVAHIYKLQARFPTLRNDADLLLEEALLLKTNGGHLAEATKILERAHKLTPENSAISSEYGLFLAVPEESQRKTEGIALLRSVVEREPAEARYHYYLARALDDVYLCWAAGLDSGCEDEPQGCAEAIREYHRAAELATGPDIWSRGIRIWAAAKAMDIFHRYARKEGDILTGKLSMPLEERLKEIQYLIRAGASGSRMGREDNPQFWVPQLQFALGDIEAADRQIRDILQSDHQRGPEPGTKYWEDEPHVRVNRAYFEFFEKVLKASGRDPEILATVSRILQGGD